jgi:hypothetical protein
LDGAAPPVKMVGMSGIPYERAVGWAVGWNVDPAVLLVPRVAFNQPVALHSAIEVEQAVEVE